ncbi:restriction endonuclease [Streptomyces sp. NBC_00715]|uniref:restriction endonuclease n=1 Tax=Streptomyces sp. NBC_00715 TaxID=2975811 RepID=UPI00386C80F2
MGEQSTWPAARSAADPADAGSRPCRAGSHRIRTLIRRLFEKIGLKSWVTQASRDDRVDAVAVNEEPLIGGLCIIQAKRSKNAVPAEAVRALAGVMHDKAAAKDIVVTTASRHSSSSTSVSTHSSACPRSHRAGKHAP